MPPQITFDKTHYHVCVQRKTSSSHKDLYDYQEEAINKLDEINQKKTGFSGLLVLPTGAGKTFTAVWWILRAYIDKGYKVLWIAHRHELLNQAAETFINASTIDTLPHRKAYTLKVLSGIHGRSVSLQTDDDLVIASKDSVNAGFKYYQEKWLGGYNEKLLLVIDEAHHATAKTYRSIIENLKGEVKTLNVLGLTATPVRTAEKEKGYLKLVFSDDILFKVDMSTLILRGILSEPIFEEVSTKIDMTKRFTEDQIKRIIKYDFDRLPVDSLNSIAQNAKRNRIIVDTYLNNKDKYKQTIVFALNISNAIALNKLFTKSGIKSNYVISGIQDGMTKVNVSAEHNRKVLQDFRDGILEVLINVNILTEGTDVPNVQSIFLARPTISPILITQMIGRGLRGIKAGGTEQAYIVSFIDDWKGKINFISPERLIKDEKKYIPDTVRVSTQGMINIVPIKLLELFTQALDNRITDSGNMGIMEHIPVGCYSFDYPIKGKIKNCDILVYDDMKSLFEEFITHIAAVSSSTDFSIAISSIGTHHQKESVHFNKEDFISIGEYYYTTGLKPEFIPFTERSKYDITELANTLFELKLDETKKTKYLKQLWDDSKNEYRAFWGSKNFDTFCIAVDYELSRIGRASTTHQRIDTPNSTYILPPKEEMDLDQLKKHYPAYYEELRESIFIKYQDEEGYYFSALVDEDGNRFKSKRRIDFHIDHIHPRAHGGLSIKENLQLISRIENLKKGTS